MPRADAGAIFGATLRRFARLRIVALALIVVGAAAKFLVWETHAATAWLVIRWLAIAFLAVSLLYEILVLERAIETRRRELRPELAEDDPRRRAFNVLHHRAEMLMKLSLFAAVIALFFS